MNIFHESYALWAEVIVPIALPKPLTYAVPERYVTNLKPGCRVVVNVGKQKIYTAIVYRILKNPPDGFDVKSILERIDEYPVVTERQIEFWKWIAEYYMCTIGEVMSVALPSALRLSGETHFFSAHPVPEVVLSDRENAIMLMFQSKPYLTIDDVAKLLGIKTVQPVLNGLIQKKCIIAEQEMKKGFIPKTESYISLTSDSDNEDVLKQVFDDLVKAPAQLETLMRFIHLSGRYTGKPRNVKKTELLACEKVSYQTIRELIKKNVFEEKLIEVGRFHMSGKDESAPYALTDEQLQAYSNIQQAFLQKKTVLLYGVTSSGKTEVYVSLIRDCIKEGKQVLYLLPEIALTSQLIQRLEKFFPDQIGVYHSRFNDHERVEIWNTVLCNESRFKIILGARSALFLPYQNLGLIIVDEEHDASYKQQDPAPRYNARDASIVLSKMFDARVLLGSATPSIESFFNSQTGKYVRVELNKRFGSIELPQITVVDLKKEHQHKRMQSFFSTTLISEIQQALERREQVILFQNRRGYSLVVQCSDCGWIPSCKNCDISLIYHKSSSQLRCHYCGYAEPMPDACISCGSVVVDQKGFGTEKIEDDLQQIFPTARIARLDLDTTRKKNAYQQLLQHFSDGTVDILVGTQMVTKGLDFDRVSLVGILHADNLLHFPDFRAHERAFQLMEQVSGRAGRRDKQGRVLIQTYHPTHQVISQVLRHDYLSLYAQELNERQQFHYPPFYKLIEIVLKARDYNEVKDAAKQFAFNLQQQSLMIYGPEVPPVGRIRNQFLFRLLIKMETGISYQFVKEMISNAIIATRKNEAARRVSFHIDVDPC